MANRVDPLILTDDQYINMALKQVCHQFPDKFPECQYWLSNVKHDVSSFDPNGNMKLIGTAVVNRRNKSNELFLGKTQNFTLSFKKVKDNLGLPSVELTSFDLE